MTTLTRVEEANSLGFEDKGNFFKKIVEKMKNMPQELQKHYQGFKAHIQGKTPERLPDR